MSDLNKNGIVTTGPEVAKLVSRFNKKELAGLILKLEYDVKIAEESLVNNDMSLKKQLRDLADEWATKTKKREQDYATTERALADVNNEVRSLNKSVAVLETKIERIQDVIKMYYSIKYPEHAIIERTDYGAYHTTPPPAPLPKPEELLMLDHIVAIAEGKL